MGRWGGEEGGELAIVSERPFGREGRQQLVQQFRIQIEFDARQSRIFISVVRGFTGMRMIGLLQMRPMPSHQIKGCWECRGSGRRVFL